VSPKTRVVQIDIGSQFEMVDFVHLVFDTLAQELGFDADSSHWMSVAIRESVTNGIRHGNKLDPSKRVIVRFECTDENLIVEVEDEGKGFNLSSIPDPLSDENLLRANGRGIFFMKSFMDEVAYLFPPNRGTSVRMVKRIPGAVGEPRKPRNNDRKDDAEKP
jgi:serine/threonine-protein kinase RsbW